MPLTWLFHLFIILNFSCIFHPQTTEADQAAAEESSSGEAQAKEDKCDGDSGSGVSPMIWTNMFAHIFIVSFCDIWRIE